MNTQVTITFVLLAVAGAVLAGSHNRYNSKTRVPVQNMTGGKDPSESEAKRPRLEVSLKRIDGPRLRRTNQILCPEDSNGLCLKGNMDKFVMKYNFNKTFLECVQLSVKFKGAHYYACVLADVSLSS